MGILFYGLAFIIVMVAIFLNIGIDTSDGKLLGLMFCGSLVFGYLADLNSNEEEI